MTIKRTFTAEELAENERMFKEEIAWFWKDIPENATIRFLDTPKSSLFTFMDLEQAKKWAEATAIDCYCPLCEREKEVEEALTLQQNDLLSVGIVNSINEDNQIELFGEAAEKVDEFVLSSLEEELVTHRTQHFNDMQPSKDNEFFGRFSDTYSFEKLYDADDPLEFLLTLPSKACVESYKRIMNGEVPPGIH